MLYGAKGVPFKVVSEFGRNHSGGRIIRFSFYYKDGVSVYWDEEYPEK